MRDLVRRAPVAMLIESGPEHRCEMVNDKFTALLGYTVRRHSRCHRLGLLSMKERIGPVGGTIEIHSKQGAGTIVSFMVPVAGSTEKPDARQKSRAAATARAVRGRAAVESRAAG